MVQYPYIHRVPLEPLRLDELQHREGRAQKEAVGQRGFACPPDDRGHGVRHVADSQAVRVGSGGVDAGRAGAADESGCRTA